MVLSLVCERLPIHFILKIVYYAVLYPSVIVVALRKKDSVTITQFRMNFASMVYYGNPFPSSVSTEADTTQLRSDAHRYGGGTKNFGRLNALMNITIGNRKTPTAIRKANGRKLRHARGPE
jgi:hypothetical protein